MQEVDWLFQVYTKRADVYNENNIIHEKKWDIESVWHFVRNYERQQDNKLQIKKMPRNKGKILKIIFLIYNIFLLIICWRWKYQKEGMNILKLRINESKEQF